MTALFFSAGLLIMVTLNALIGALLIAYGIRTRSSNRLLGSYFLGMAFGMFVTWLLSTGRIVDYPHFFRTGNVIVLIYIPLAYLFVRSSVRSQPLQARDFLHFIPALICLIDFMPFFLLPGGEKVAFFHTPDLFRKGLSFEESLIFPAGFYTALRPILAFVYWVLQVLLLRGIFRQDTSQFRNDNRALIRWLVIFVVLQITLFIPPLPVLPLEWQYNSWIIFLFCGGGIGLTSIAIFLFPQVLYGSKGTFVYISEPTPRQQDFQKPSPTDDIHNPQTEAKLKYLSDEKLIAIGSLILAHVENQKPFLKRHYTISELGNEVNIPTQYISAYLNHHLKVKFNEFINRYRVQHCISLILKNAHQQQTLESIAVDSGFNNRATFISAFRKETGFTPSEYIKSQPTDIQSIVDVKNGQI